MLHLVHSLRRTERKSREVERVGNGKRRADDRRGMRQRLVVGYRSLPFTLAALNLHLTKGIVHEGFNHPW